MEAITLPLVRRLMEDWRLEGTPDGKTKLTWLVFYEPTLLTRMLHPLVRAIFGRMFRQSIAGLQRYLSLL